MSEVLPPPKRPCATCPYRLNIPAGIWHPEEYEKLPEYDLPTGEQPPGIFLCHQRDGRMCAGWVGCHDMEESLALRLAVALGRLTPELAREVVDYRTDVPLHPSGTHAAEHGLSGVLDPDDRAVDAITKLEHQRQAGTE